MVLKLLFGMMPLVFIFYGYFLFVMLRRGRQTIFKRKFFHAVVSVLNRNAGDIKRCIPQIELNFRSLSERYPTTSRDIKSSVSLLEDMIHQYDVLRKKGFKSRFNLEITNDVIKTVTELLDMMKQQNPFVSLSPQDASFLVDLKRSLESNNPQLGLTTLRSLSDTLENKDARIKIETRRSTTAIAVAAVGAFLTIFFGLLSFLPL